jgi:hypothetical protein
VLHNETSGDAYDETLKRESGYDRVPKNLKIPLKPCRERRPRRFVEEQPNKSIGLAQLLLY